MASSSSSSSLSHEKCDVFLSFRGEDTRESFTSHLNAALCRRKIQTFIDNELRRGDEISESLLNAIEGSKISIIVFSKRYASSRWCLEELIKILDCKKMYGQIVIPVFYRIDPSDVRKQTGTFGDAFAEHEVRFQERKEMLKGWRNALTEAANLFGFDSNVIRPESKLIETIIEHILKRLSDMSSCDNKNLFGVAVKIRSIKSLLFNGSKEVCKVGIWGMGGIGKTTLADAVFNDISSEFEASHFIQNVREASNKNQLRHLQEKLLSKILEDEHIDIRLTFTKERLRRKRVLIVFDDVTDLKQIKELIGDLENLGSGSQIIITTRDQQVLKNCGLNDSTIYKVEGLFNDESRQLFKQHAFNQNHPIDKDYMELSNRVISYTKGVPLALEVLGLFLLGREKLEWESALDELKRSPNEVIQTVLKISYDGLGNREKDLFLDIACFFKGWDKNLVSSFSSLIGISVLIDKALITISQKTIRMHDLIQEMGWEIVRQEPVNKLGQCSRLWHHDDVYRVLKQNLGTDTIRGLRFDSYKITEIHLNPHALSNMDSLRFLIVYNSYWRGNNKVHGFEGVEFDFKELRCISWDDYPCTSLPLKFCPENLVVLEMHHSNLKQLWIGVKELANVKYIDLSHSLNLLKVPDLSGAQNLERLILEGCTSLLEITSPSQNLNKLVNLNLRNCKRLISLPIGIQSKSLRDVILSGCSNLKTAPRISCNMERLCLDGTAIKKLSSSIESLSRLVELNLKYCSRLESLPSSVCNLKSLRQLNLSGLSNLKMVPEIPCKIEELYLDGTAIKELSSSIENASSLVRLTLKDCSSLESLPDSICKLKSLKYLCISGCSKLVRLPEDIGDLESLEVLEANGNSEHCLRLESLPSSIRNLNLRVLSLSGLSYLKMVPEFPLKIEELCLDGTAIKELSSSIENASSLVRLSLQDCSNLESLPDEVCKLKSLKYLCISGCSKLDKLPEDIGHLESLEVLEANGISSMMGLQSIGLSGLRLLSILNLNHCSLTELPNNLDQLALLRDLELEGNNFESIPTNIINFSKLRLLNIRFCNRLRSLPKLPRNIIELRADGELNLKYCSRLESLPSSVCNLKSLRQLNLSSLSNLKMVPEIPCKIEKLYLDGTAIKELSSSIENASSLVRLTLKDCSSLESLPDSICKLKSLKYLCISGCSKLVRLPEDIGDLESLEVLEANGNSEHCLMLESLPSSFRNLNLRMLSLSGLSYLKMVPEFPLKIEELYLDGTAIKELSSSIENASSLVRLSLQDCSNLERLPDEVCKLKSLEYLCISGCSKLDKLPEDIGHLESLEVLEANGISSMMGLQSIGLSGLRLLSILNLNHCSLTELPNNLDQLALLRDLELEGNNFESVPTNIINFSKLRLLNIRFCNRLRSLPKLPRNIIELRADGCKLLKALSGLTNPLSQGQCERTLSFSNCVSLDWNALRNILNDAVLDMYSDEFERFKYQKNEACNPQGVMCFPGRKVPEWFNIQSSGSVIVLPQGSFNHEKFLGFVLCAIVEGQDHDCLDEYILNVEYELGVKCLYEYMTFDKKLLSVGPTYIKSDHVLLGYNCNTCDLFEFSGDTEATIIFKSGKNIKECGVRLLFTQEFEEPMKRPRYSIFDEEGEQEEAKAYSVSKGFKSSNFFKGNSSSRSGLNLVLHEKEVSDNKNLVGIAMKIQSIKSLLFDGLNEVCKVVGIWGIGGIGKSTLADAVFNEISNQFEGSYFIPNVREKSEKCELSHLQEELLSKILEDEHPNIRLTCTKERLRRKRLLIVFDDLRDLKQINELIGDLENLGSKSRIIITTRDQQLLRSCGLNNVTSCRLNELCRDESLQLFKQHAFKQKHLIDEDFMELSNRVISYTRGLPLALKVLGSFLLGRKKCEWESTLQKLESPLHTVIETVLRISFDGLDDEEKELFLDIACFFEGCDKYLVGKFSSHIGISVLIDKALITISYRTIRMHDLLQQMGRNIVRQDSAYKHSRLWDHNDVYRVLKNKKGTDAIRGLCFDMANMKEIHLNPYAFSEEEQKEAYSVSKGFKSSNFFKGESSSRSGLNHEKEVKEFNPFTNEFNQQSANECSSFSFDSNELPQDFVESTMDVIATTTQSSSNNDGVEPSGSGLFYEWEWSLL